MVNDALKVLGRRRFERHFLARARMREDQTEGVQHLPRRRPDPLPQEDSPFRQARRDLFGRAAIIMIADDGIAEVLKVNADLVAAARVKVRLHERQAVSAPQDAPMSVRFAAIAAHCHLSAVALAAANGRVNGSAVFVQRPGKQNQIGPLHAARCELRGQGFVRRVIFRDGKKARRIFVNAMDDAGAFDASDA